MKFDGAKIIPEWNGGQTEQSKILPVNIFDNLSDEKISELVRKVQKDQELAEFYTYAIRMLELETRDYNSAAKENEKVSQEISERLAIKRFYDMAILGTKNEQEMAKKILAIKAELN